MSINKKGYFFMILFLGIGLSGIGLIYAHSTGSPYSGIGYSGIHAINGGSIHIPGEIIFDSNNDFSITIIHNATADRVFTLPDHEGTYIIIEVPFSCPALRAITGFDINGDPICTII